MPRKRDPRRERALEIYKESSGQLKLKEIAEKLEVGEGTVRGWKAKDKWEEKLNGTLRINMRNAPNKNIQKKARSPSKKNNNEHVEDSAELTDKQRDFCIYYIQCWNATKAYMKAYKSTWQTANVNGSRLLGNASVRAEIERLKEDRSKAMMIDNQAILQKYVDIAFADITDFIEFGQEEIIDIDPVTGEEVPKFVNRVKFKASNEVDGTIINEVRQGKDGVSVKLADKMKALEILSKYVDLLPDSTLRKLQEEKLKLQIEKAKSPEEKESSNQPSIDLTALTEEELMALESIIGKSTNAEPDKS